METEEFQTETVSERAVAEADRIWRANPIPVVLGALGVGLLIGMAVRSMEHPKSTTDELRDRLEETEEYLRDLMKVAGKKAKKRYRDSSDYVKGSLEKAADVASSVDLDDYVDPASKWFKRLFRR